jgi:hypothetical protein
MWRSCAIRCRLITTILIPDASRRQVRHVDRCASESHSQKTLQIDAAWRFLSDEYRSQIGDTDGQFFASSSYNPARRPIPLAKKVQVEQALTDAKVTDLKKGEELWKPWICDPEFSVRRIRFQSQERR